MQQTEVVQTNEENKNDGEVDEGDSDYLQPCLALPKNTCSAIVTPTLSPTTEEEDYQLPKAFLQV